MRDIDRCDVCQGPLLPDKTCADAECRMAWADPLEPVEDEPEESEDVWP